MRGTSRMENDESSRSNEQSTFSQTMIIESSRMLTQRASRATSDKSYRMTMSKIASRASIEPLECLNADFSWCATLHNPFLQHIDFQRKAFNYPNLHHLEEIPFHRRFLTIGTSADSMTLYFEGETNSNDNDNMSLIHKLLEEHNSIVCQDNHGFRWRH